MQNNPLNTTSSSVYPGEYIPPFNEDKLKKALKHTSQRKRNSLPVNIIELGNSYKIELAIPGVNRENLFLKAYGNVLFISVIHNHHEVYNQNEFQLHEFHLDGHFTRKIVLPNNADTLLVRAEYKAGILHLYVPKSTCPVKRNDIKIAIY